MKSDWDAASYGSHDHICICSEFFWMHGGFFHGVCRSSVIRSPFRSFVKVPLHEIIWCVSVPPWLIFSLSLALAAPPLSPKCSRCWEAATTTGSSSPFPFPPRWSIKGETGFLLNLCCYNHHTGLIIICLFFFFLWKRLHKTVRIQSHTQRPLKCRYYTNEIVKRGESCFSTLTCRSICNIWRIT